MPVTEMSCTCASNIAWGLGVGGGGGQIMASVIENFIWSENSEGLHVVGQNFIQRYQIHTILAWSEYNLP